MLPEIKSLFANSHPLVGEVFAELLTGGSFRLEKIQSRAASSPPGFWYDQINPEWVALFRGSATLEFEAGSLSMNAGDYLLIPAHLKHRVASTSADAVWLALHFQAD